MEGLGDKFQKARIARNLTLDDAGRMTKIRPAKLAEIEAEDFSSFPSLAYAKGFILIYGKFLNVDVTPYLEAFEGPDQVTTDGYSYLQDNDAPPPPRPTKVVVRREPSSGGGGGGRQRSSLLPLAIGLVILVGGWTALKFMMDVRRITPSSQRDANALAQASVAPAPGTNAPANVAPQANMVAPKALPADGTPPPNAVAMATPPVAAAPATGAAEPAATPLSSPPAVAAAAAAPEAEPEIRRAEPVRPEDLIPARNAGAEPAADDTTANRFDIRPLRKTYVRVVVDNAGGASFDRWINPTDRPVQFRGKRIAVKVLDPQAVEIRKNGKVVSASDADIILE